MRTLFLVLLLAGCADGGSWSRAQLLAAQARTDQGDRGWAHPLWVDVARECARVMPWHEGYREARALRRAIEDGRRAALEAPP